jgi:hypothetical protein
MSMALPIVALWFIMIGLHILSAKRGPQMAFEEVSEIGND